MTSGIGLLDILVSEITMLLGAVLFLFFGVLLILKRKTLRGCQRSIATAAVTLTGLYLLFILWLVILWG